MVSAHAHCPVLLLGPVSTFSPPNMIARVVVGLVDSRAGRAAVDFAVAEAVRRNVALHLLRLEPSASFGTSPSNADGAWPAPGPRAEAELSMVASRIRHQYPDLTVVADVVHGEAAELLPSYSDSSTILVVGCHHSDDHWSTRLGPVATSAVHRNRGAVVVVGQAPNQVPPEPTLPLYRLGAVHH
jgi:nucleotide-binding universal stress UspA family protein